MNQNYNFVRGLFTLVSNAKNEEFAAKKGTSFKSLLLLVVFAFFASIPMQGQTYFTESFEGAWYLNGNSSTVATAAGPNAPGGWTQTRVLNNVDPIGGTSNGAQDWSQSAYSASAYLGTTNPYVGVAVYGPTYSPGVPPNGNNILWFRDGACQSGNTRRMESPIINLSSSISPVFSFSYSYGASSSAISVVASSDGGTTWSTIYTVPSTPTTSISWATKTIAIPTSFKVANAKIGIQIAATYGSYDAYFDNFVVREGTAPTGTPITFSATAVSQSGMTIGWVDNSADETGFRIYRSTDNINFIKSGSDIISNSAATLGAAYTSVLIGLTPGTTYYYKIVAFSSTLEGETPSLNGLQATVAGATYYWVGTTGGLISAPANWNTMADGTGTTRTTPGTTDILIVDGDGFVGGGATTISVDAISFFIGQLIVNSNTALTLQSSSTTTRTITITGGPGDDFVVANGSTLSLNHAANAVAFAFSGTGNTGNIAGTVNLAGNASNLITTTGGTGTLVTVASTGIVNLGASSSGGGVNSLVGSAATLSFLAGSNCNSTGATTGAPAVPLATWDTTSTLTITGLTTSTTTATNNNQSFGNIVFNCPLLTSTLNWFGSTTTGLIKGNLTITAAGATGGTGIFRATSSTGSVRINGNVTISQGRFQATSTSTGSVIANGDTTIGANGILELSTTGTGGYSQRGATLTNNGVLTGTAGSLSFINLTGSFPQTLAGTGTVLTNLATLSVQNTAGITITHTNPIILARANLIQGTITGSNKITFGTGLAVNCATQIGATGLTTPGGNLDSAPTFNLGTGTYALIYSQETTSRTTGFEVPSNRAVNTLSLTNVNGLVVAGGGLNTGTLTFQAGSGNITTTTANLLTVTGTATTSIVRTSTTAYVNGPLALTLPAPLVSGSTYTFPIGKGTLNPFALVNPVTVATVGATVTVQAEVFDAATGGTPGTLMGALNPNRYWAASITAGASNFTDTQIQLFDTTTGLDAIASSATLGGAYSLVGGVTSTTTATSLTSTAPKATTLPGYFVMGNKAAATLTNLAITPTGNACANVVRTVTVTATPGGGAVSGVVINYSINGAAQTAIAMTSTGGDNWSGVIPTVTPVNAAIVWSVTATDANALTKTAIGTPYSDEPTLGVTATANASLATVCATSPSVLSFGVTKPGLVSIGAATTVTGATSQPTAFCNRWSSYRMQTIYTAAELIAAGLNAGNITSMAFNTTSLGDGATNANFVVKIGATSLSAFTDFVPNTGFTSVFPSATYTHIIGLNTITFSTPYNWDGISNIVVEVSHDGADSTNNSITYYTATVGNTVAYSTNGGTTASLSTNRLNTIFSGNSALPPSAYSWSDGTTVVGTTNPFTVNPTATTTYTGTATLGGCPIVAAPVTVTALPLPTAPTAVSTTQCGSIVPLAAVTATSGTAGTGTFNWYAAPTGGVALQTSTSTTYLAVVSATTTFYVSESGVNACESARTPVTITVLTPPTLTLSTAPSAICTGTSTTTPVTITSTLSDYTNYSWSPSTSVTGTTGSGFTFNPTETTTYVLSGSNTVTTCATTANLVVTVNPLPLITSATTSSEPLCLGSSTTLTAVSIPAAPGSATVGTGTTLTPSYGYPTAFDNYYYQVWQQYLFKASELNALGLVAGNINSITFKIAAVNDANEPLADYNVRIGSTPDNILTGFTTAGLTNVFGPSTVTAAVGLNTITFTTPYNWDGFSNIVIDLRQTGAYGSANATTYYTATNYNSVLYATSSSDNSSFWTSGPTPSTSTSRPNIIFGGQVGANLTSSVDWTWSPATALSATTGNVVTANPTVSTVYTVTAVNPITTCTTARTVSVSLLPLPSAPTATNATQCGEQLSTASVTSTTGLTTPIFVWYAAPTGGVALQTGTSTTYTTAITATTTLYVTEYNGSCESVRVPVVMTVTAPPTIAITSTVPSFCGTGGAATLTATSADTGMTYSWASLTPSATLSAAIGASVSATLSETSNFMVTGTAADLTCLPITSYVSIGVYALPSATVATDANGVCPGTSANISSGLSAGNFAVSSIPYAATESPLTSSSIMKNGVAIRPLSGGSMDDGGWSGIPIGFNFNYFGTDFSTISAGTNGLLMFGTPPGYGTGTGELGQFGFTGPTYFPNTANPANIIALMATDMHMGTNTVDGSIKYWTEGYAPNRVFVIQYKNVNSFSANPSATVQCRLYETIGVVEIHILEKTFSRSAIVGLQDATQTIGAVAPGRAGGTWTVTTPEAWRFTPPANYNTIWTATTVNGSSTLASGTNIFTQTVAPAITTTYSISYTNQTTGCANAAGSAQTIMSVLGNVAPTGVNTITSATSICTGQTVNFSLDYTGSMDGLAFQWESFDGTTWSDIALATTTTYSTIPATATQYRCRIVACNGVPGYSSTASIVLANAIATTTPATRCGIGTASLSATANTGTTINWYDAITGGNLVGTGSPFITPTINASTTYYVGAETIGGTISGGKLAPESTWTGSTITDWGIVFNALQSRTLNSVDVYSTTAGTLDLKITDSSGIELFSTGNINVSAGGTTTPTTIPLNFNLVEGTIYKILVKDYSGVSLIRGSSNLAFPYNNGTVNVTSSEWGGTTTGTYYYIYNLQTTSICSSIRVAVTATVTAPPVIVLSANPATICSEQTSAAVTVVTGRSDYDTYAWTPSLTVSGNATTGWVFNPLTTTSYTLVASQSTGLLPCSNTASISVTVIPTPSVLTISPTPGSVCIDTVLPLVSSGGTLENMPLLNENFNGTSNTWTTVNNSTGGTPSAADWTLQPDGYSYGSFFSTIFNSNDNSQFYMSNSDAQGSSSITNTELKSPVFSTNGFSVANLSFYHYLRSPETATVDYSINGGATWVNIQTYTTTQGTSTGFVNENLPLPAGALNQASVQIRFNYIDSYGYYWAIDNVSISGTQVATMVWSPRTNLYSDAAATVPYTGGNASTVYVKSSTGAATTTYTATATSALGCARTATVPVTIYQTLAPTGLQFYQFCPSAGTTVNDMSATLIGTAIKWYTVPSGGVALAPTAALTQGYYWATQTANGCESNTRFAVFAISNATAAPSSNPLQQFCNAATVASLTANGTGLNWYTTPTGGVALASTASIATGTYYVAQTTGGCESPRTAVAVIVSAVSAPTGPATQSLSSLLTIGDIVVVGTNVVWYASSTDAATGQNPIPASQLLANTTYYATQTVSGCTSTTSLAVTITTLANQDFDMTQFSYYPNPVIDLLNVSYSQDMTNVKVFNLIGQQLLNKEVNATTTQIDMSGYANGAYFIQVSTENAMKTVRVIKK